MASHRGLIDVDLVTVYDAPTRGKVLSTLTWGDAVTVRGKSGGALEVELDVLETGGESTNIEQRLGYIRPPSRKSGLALEDLITREKQDPGVLKIDFVDVQQGDAALIETASGKVVLLDGGDNQLFARYLATRFPGTSAQRPKAIDCIVVTHGDADHFAGLTAIAESESYVGASLGEELRKRLFIHPRRVYHNGLVKRPGKLPSGKSRADAELLGATRTVGGRRYITGLVDDLLDLDVAEMNQPFRRWAAALTGWRDRHGPIAIRRLGRSADADTDDDAFDFLARDGVEVEILGPELVQAGGRDALPLLGSPVPKAERGPDAPRRLFTGVSASHTINGHSIVLRLKYGNCRVLFAGDLNEQAETTLVEAHSRGELDLTAEIFKVPHHGSADFAVPFLRAVSPAVSVISSGDENERKEYIHPRATIVGGLGKHSRPTLDEPLILVTELAAFFEVEGWVVSDPEAVRHKKQIARREGEWFAFSRKRFGVVKVRTDGRRMLVFTYSGKDDMQEAYAFKLHGERVIPEPLRRP